MKRAWHKHCSTTLKRNSLTLFFDTQKSLWYRIILSCRASSSTCPSRIRGLVNLAIRRAKQCQVTYTHIGPFPTIFLEDSDQITTMLYYVLEWAFIFVGSTLYFMGICDVYIYATLLPHSPNLLALTSFCIARQLKKKTIRWTHFVKGIRVRYCRFTFHSGNISS